MLLHELVAVPSEDWQVYPRRHTAGSVYPRNIRLRLAQEEQVDELRVERRDQGRKDRTLRENSRSEKSQSIVESTSGDR